MTSSLQQQDKAQCHKMDINIHSHACDTIEINASITTVNKSSKMHMKANIKQNGVISYLTNRHNSAGHHLKTAHIT